MRHGKRTAIIWLPSEYAHIIGEIIVHWATFEDIFDSILRILIDGEKADNIKRENISGWEAFQFKRRRKLLTDICDTWLSGRHSKAAESFIALTAQAGDLSNKRNMLAHGKFLLTLPPFSAAATDCRAQDRRTGKYFPFDEYILQKLKHDIGHLGPDYVETLKMAFELSDEPHSFSDTELLRAYHGPTHPWNPNPAKRPSPPQSSPE